MTSARDPTAVACPYVERLPVLGVPTTFETNAPEVMERVLETWGSWADLRSRPELLSPARATVRIVVDPWLASEEPSAAPSPAGSPAGRPASPPAESAGDAGPIESPVDRAGRAVASGPAGRPDAAASPAAAASRPRLVALTRRRLVVSGPGVEGEADAERGRSVARVAPACLTDGEAFAADVLEPLTLFLLGALDRQPLHAAAVVRAGTAVLLAGPSGAGKSTLAHAARRAGFAVLTDEPVYVQIDPRLRVWGRRSHLHLEPAARAHFPDLPDGTPTALPTGKTKLVVPEGAGDPRWAERVGICLLERAPAGGAAPELRPVAPAAVVAALTGGLDPGYDLYADTIGERILRIAEGGAWTLRWSGGPDVALPLLDEAARTIGRTA